MTNHINANSVQHTLKMVNVWEEYKMTRHWAPGWLSQLGIWLQLRSWSCSLWVQAPRWALCWQLRAWSLLRIMCLSLSLCPSPAHALSLSLSRKWINIKKKKFKEQEKLWSYWGIWVAQLVMCLTARSLLGILPPPLPNSCVHMLTLSQKINK